MQFIKFTYLTFALLFIVSLGGKAQTYTISGIVVDADDNRPLVGVSIVSTSSEKIDGKSNGSFTISGVDGKFTLKVSGRQELSAIYIGYKTAFITVKISKDCHGIVRMVTDERKNKNKKSEFEFYTSERNINKSKTESSDPKALSEKGDDYYIKKDYTNAVYWYQKAAELGYARAQTNLGYCYESGQGVQKDYTQAVYWYQKAAEQGNASAQNNLAKMQKNSTTLTTTSENTTANIVQSHINKTSQLSKKAIETTPSQKRMALIVGNSDYKNGRLINPANDAADLTKKFKSLGFETTGRTNKDKRELKDEISNFCIKAKNYDAAIFYYAGHAMQDKGINYLVPIDATINSPADIEYECIDMNWVLRSMEEAGIKTKIIILDACRNNPVAQSWERSLTTSGLTNLSQVPVGTYLVFATQAGKVAKDGVGQRNSPYTKALLKMLDVPGLPVHELFHEVKKLVAKQTNQEQIPSETNNLLGDFIINAQ